MWKDFERRVARQLGGRRVGATGTSTPDVIAWDGGLCVEAKERKILPAWLVDPLHKVRAHAGEHRLGIVCWHQAGRRDGVVVMALSDFTAWFGSPGTADLSDE